VGTVKGSAVSDGYKIQVNIKGDEGYDAPLINVCGDTQEEFQSNVGFVLDNADNIMSAVVALQAAYKLKKPKDEPREQKGRSWSNSGSQQSQQAPAASEATGPAPECRHGAMKYVPAGVSKRTNKAYSAFWSCTGPRNDQCDTQPAN
jgi:hypothetical protein